MSHKAKPWQWLHLLIAIAVFKAADFVTGAGSLDMLIFALFCLKWKRSSWYMDKDWQNITLLFSNTSVHNVMYWLAGAEAHLRISKLGQFVEKLLGESILDYC